jgi:hypothetical protein
VHPDRFIAVQIEGDGEIAEPLSDAPDVLVVPQRLVEECGDASTKTMPVTRL